jgi:hypothetical protein
MHVCVLVCIRMYVIKRLQLLFQRSFPKIRDLRNMTQCSCRRYLSTFLRTLLVTFSGQMEAVGFSETLVSIYQTTRRHIPNDSVVQNHSRENLRSYSVLQSLLNEETVHIVPRTPLRRVYNIALWGSMQTFNQLHWRRMKQKPIHE